MPMETKSGLSRPTLEPLTRRSVIGGLNHSVAQAVHGMYGWMENLALQAHPLTATGIWLVWWGKVFNVDYKYATRSTGIARFTGEDGATVLVGSKLSHPSGVEFKTLESGVVAGGFVDVEIQSLVTGGSVNLASDSILTLMSSLASMDSVAVVSAPGLTGGSDDEIEGRPFFAEGFRGRILDKHRNPDHGGNPTDYERRAMEVAGVTRAWTTVGEQGAASVTVRFVMDDVRADQDGIPQGDGAPNYTGDLKTVYDHIMSKRRIVGRLFVQGPINKPIDVEISELDPDTAEVRAAIEVELQAMFDRESVLAGTMESSWFGSAVSVAAGEDSHKINAPLDDVTCLEYEIPTLGNVTYV